VLEIDGLRGLLGWGARERAIDDALASIDPAATGRTHLVLYGEGDKATWCRSRTRSIVERWAGIEAMSSPTSVPPSCSRMLRCAPRGSETKGSLHGGWQELTRRS
jgi:hypothetical protein